LAQGFLSGDILTLGDGDIWALAGIWLAVLLLQVTAFNTLLLDALDPGLTRISRRRAQFARAAFIILLSVLAMLAARTVGVLLATALLVLPAASARLFTRSAARALMISCVIGVVSGVTGLLLSTVPAINAPPGALMILCSSAIFLLALIFRR
jgi:zinc transport system permease protein